MLGVKKTRKRLQIFCVNALFFTFRRSVFSVPVSAVSGVEGTKKVQYPAPF